MTTPTTCVIDHRDGQPHAATIGQLCTGCYRRLERTIAELPAIHTWLRSQLEPGASPGERVTTSLESPAPMRVDVHDERVDIAGKLASWARLVAEQRDLRGPTNDHPETTAPYLLAHLDWITAQPWVDACWTELVDAARDAHGIAPWRPATHRLPAPCPHCDTLALVRHDGDDQVICDHRTGGCGRRWSETDYRRLVVILAAEIA